MQPLGRGPFIHPENEQFWSSIREHYLRLQRCDRCQTLRFPVCSNCYNCLATDHTWEAIEPEGTVATVLSIERQTIPGTAGVWGQERVTRDEAWKEAIPYHVALVDMKCGLRLPGRLLCTCRLALKHGTQVQAVVIQTLSGNPINGFAHECVL